ncbi:DUF2304 domain-containing protein [bacterium]|nr:DUF2304 domain-containing protein [bacterium]
MFRLKPENVLSQKCSRIFRLVGKKWLRQIFSALWAAIAIAAMIPRTTDRVAQAVGVERGADLFVYAGVLVLLYAVYRLFVRTQKMQEEITELVRQIALQHSKVPVKKVGEKRE